MQYFLRCNGCALIVAVPREDGGLYIFAKGFLPNMYKYINTFSGNFNCIVCLIVAFVAWVAQNCIDHVVGIWNNCCFLILGLWQMLQKSKFDSENNRLGLFKIVEMICANWCEKSKIKSKFPIRFEIRIKGKWNCKFPTTLSPQSSSFSPLTASSADITSMTMVMVEIYLNHDLFRIHNCLW